MCVCVCVPVYVSDVSLCGCGLQGSPAQAQRGFIYGLESGRSPPDAATQEVAGAGAWAQTRPMAFRRRRRAGSSGCMRDADSDVGDDLVRGRFCEL